MNETRELTARLGAAERAARAAARAVRDAARLHQAAHQEWAAALAAVQAHQAATRRRSLLEAVARHFRPAPAASPPAWIDDAVTCWAEHRSQDRPWVHAAPPGAGRTLCGIAAGPPAGAAAARHAPGVRRPSRGILPPGRQWPEPPGQ
jgi:hypothetical protein